MIQDEWNASAGGRFDDSPPASPAIASAPGMDKVVIAGRLERLADLPHDWDGQDALPIDPGVIEAASRFLASLPPDSISSPQVVPMTRGRLQFEWHRGDRSLELEFENPTTIRYLKYDPDRGIEEEDVLAPTDSTRLIGLLLWFGSE